MKSITVSIQAFAVIFSLVFTAFADITIKQQITTSGQKFVSTKQIKGARERTEQRIEMNDPAAAAFMPQVATITQCDLKRRIQINDRSQMYFIDPFNVPDNTAPATRPSSSVSNGPTRKGGTMTMTYSVRDTGERKMMFGLEARHLITTQEMESSADSCNGPNKTKMEFDGWYVDFNVDFNCESSAVPGMPGRMPKPDCVDRVIMRGSGTAPKGIMLEGTMKMYGADGSVQMSQTTETLELNRDILDASLFDIPQGYKLAASSQDLYKISMPNYRGQNDADQPNPTRPDVNPMIPAKTVALNISGATAGQNDIDTFVRTKLAEKGLRVVSGSADFTVNINFRQIKESTGSKIGGMFGKVTGVNAGGGKVDIDLTATLSGTSTGSANVKNKFDGPLAAALRMALDQALEQLLGNID